MTRRLIFLFPSIDERVGGNIAQLNLLDACNAIRPAEAVTYRERRADRRYLDDVDDRDAIYVIHWGPDIGGLVDRLKARDVVYVAYSTGWGMKLPARIPILAGSRNTLGYWGRRAPNSLIFHIPTIISDKAALEPRAATRDIDVLVQRRKTSGYVLQQLAPALRDAGLAVTVLDGWIADLYALFRRTKVYLYDSVDHWIAMGTTEGFGMPPLEALACGCTVFSSVNDALADYLDPGFNCQKLRVFSTAEDSKRIVSALTDFREPEHRDTLIEPFRLRAVTSRLKHLLPEIDSFFVRTRMQNSDIPQPG